MSRTPATLTLIALCAALLVLPFAVGCETTSDSAAGPEPSDSIATSNRPEPQVREAQEIDDVLLPGVVIDREARTVDLDAVVVMRDGWLELVACPTQSKEHESIFAIEARPRHVHMALLMIGLEPGRPGGWRPQGDGFEPVPPQGDRVRVSVVVDGREQPLARFIKHSATGQPLTNDEFVFAGSLLEKTEGARVYQADNSGNLITLVTFSDDVLTWPVPASEANDQLKWVANPENIPPLKTPVKLRLRPAVAAAAAGE